MSAPETYTLFDPGPCVPIWSAYCVPETLDRVHWKVTVPLVNVPPGVGAMIFAGMIFASVYVYGVYIHGPVVPCVNPTYSVAPVVGTFTVTDVPVNAGET